MQALKIFKRNKRIIGNVIREKYVNKNNGFIIINNDGEIDAKLKRSAFRTFELIYLRYRIIR